MVGVGQSVKAGGQPQSVDNRLPANMLGFYAEGYDERLAGSVQE